MDKEWFEHRLRARYQETDAMRVVYHANYLNWFEISRTEWVRSTGVPYTLFEEMGLMLPIVDAQLKFVSPARYDDEIIVRNRLVGLSPLRMTFEYEIIKEQDHKVLVTGSTNHVWVNSEWRPISLKRVAPEYYRHIQEKAGSLSNSGGR
jgi:acyl-CoA thioester hydrolase